MIQEDILNKIEHGTYNPGDRLPSENQMAELYAASVLTVRRALGDLVHQNVIYRVKGKGTFVAGAGDGGENGVQGNKAGSGSERRNVKLCFLVLADTSDSSIMKMIRGAQSYLLGKGCTMSILCGDETKKDEMNLIRECLSSAMDGVIWYSVAPESCLEGLKLLGKNQIPVVMLDRGPSSIPYTLVAAYNQDGGYQMGKYLIELGHRRIIYAADQIELMAERNRIEGYKMALAESGIPYNERMVVHNCLQNTDEAAAAVKEFQATAVQCVNDKVACRVIQRLAQEGYNIPADISVSGFDNAAESEYTCPRITTIIQPFEDMGRMAAKKLLKMLSGKPMHSHTYLPVELVVKESTCPPGPG